MTTATEARDITRDLRTQRIFLPVSEVLKWPRWKFRAAIMWLDLEHKNVIPFGQFLAQREVLPHCRVCGCSDDDGCDGCCAWAEADLCTVCAGAQ
jgi:hypothetical protein